MLAQTRLPLFPLVSADPNPDYRATLPLHLKVTKPLVVSRLELEPIVHSVLFCLTLRLAGLHSVLFSLFYCPHAWLDGNLQLAIPRSQSLPACPDVSTSQDLNHALLVDTCSLVFDHLPLAR